MKRIAVFMGIISIMLSLLERGKKLPKTDFPYPVPLPEGEMLAALHMTRQGMRSGLHYIMSVEGEEIYLKMTNYHPYGEEYRFNAKDILEDSGKTCIESTKDAQVLREIEAILVDCGTVGWDGFNEKRVIKNATDTGERYEVYLLFSGGSTVSVYGCDICPNRFGEMFNRITKIFHETVKWE